MRCMACDGAFRVLATRKRQQVVYRRLECVQCGQRETSKEALMALPPAPKLRPSWKPKPRVSSKPKAAPAPKAEPTPRKLKAATVPVPEAPRFGAHNPFGLAR